MYDRFKKSAQKQDVTKQHLDNFSHNKQFLVKIAGGYDPNEAQREQVIDSLILAIHTLNSKVNDLEKELTSLKGDNQ